MRFKYLVFQNTGNSLLHTYLRAYKPGSNQITLKQPALLLAYYNANVKALDKKVFYYFNLVDNTIVDELK